MLTDDGRTDLKRLYQAAWSGELRQINGTPIRSVKPFSTIGQPQFVPAPVAFGLG